MPADREDLPRARSLLRFRRPRDPFADPDVLIRRLYRYVSFRAPQQDVEDLTNAILERGLRYRQSYDPSKGEPTAWIIGIANRALAEYFSNRPTGTHDPTKQPAESADTDIEMDTIRRLDLQATLNTLTTRDRELLALRYGADLRAREIGLLLDLETHAVEVALGRALERVRAVHDQ